MTEIAIYNEFTSQLAELKDLNSKVVFDYKDKKGNKEAKSHIAMLRKTKTGIEAARVKGKAESLAYGKKVDAEARKLKGEVDEMIDIHKTPLDEVAAIEFERSNKIGMKLLDLCSLEYEYSGQKSSLIKSQIDKLKTIEIGEDYEEKRLDAMVQRDDSLKSLGVALELAIKYEEGQAELERLQKEEAERKQKERDEMVAKEAKEAAIKQAEMKAEKVKQDALQRESNLKRAQEQAEQEKKDAILRAEQAEANAKLKAENDIAEARRKEEAEIRQREKNRENVSRVRTAAKAAMMNRALISEMQAKALILLIHSKEIPGITITY